MGGRENSNDIPKDLGDVFKKNYEPNVPLPDATYVPDVPDTTEGSSDPPPPADED